MTTSEAKINEVGRRVQENANLIWNAANSLFGAFKPLSMDWLSFPCVLSSVSTTV